MEEREDQIQISISTKGLYENTKYPYFNPYVQIFNEDNMLTDATGKEYPMANASLLFAGTPNSEIQEMTFSIPKGKYEQPLSFKVSEYPDYVKNDIQIKIK